MAHCPSLVAKSNSPRATSHEQKAIGHWQRAIGHGRPAISHRQPTVSQSIRRFVSFAYPAAHNSRRRSLLYVGSQLTGVMNSAPGVDMQNSRSSSVVEHSLQVVVLSRPLVEAVQRKDRERGISPKRCPRIRMVRGDGQRSNRPRGPECTCRSATESTDPQAPQGSATQQYASSETQKPEQRVDDGALQRIRTEPKP